MKRYKIEYFSGVRSKPLYLIQISKSGKWIGAAISFWSNEKKYCQDKYKNGLANGLDKEWRRNSKNSVFRNRKKNKTQGIEIYFKA